jgi:hypothetical protein
MTLSKIACECLLNEPCAMRHIKTLIPEVCATCTTRNVVIYDAKFCRLSGVFHR